MLYTYTYFQNRIQAISSIRAAAASLPGTIGSIIHYEHETRPDQTRPLIGKKASTEGNKKNILKKKNEKNEKKRHKILSPGNPPGKCL
jgi:hypothetical protein